MHLTDIAREYDILKIHSIDKRGSWDEEKRGVTITCYRSRTVYGMHSGESREDNDNDDNYVDNNLYDYNNFHYHIHDVNNINNDNTGKRLNLYRILS